MVRVFIRCSARIMVLQISLIVINACSDSPNSAKNSKQDLRIEIDALSTYSGESIQIKAVLINQDGTKNDVTQGAIWLTSPGKTGMITESGVFSSINNLTGVETVSAEYRAMTASIQIEVTPRADIIGLWPVVVNIQAGDNLQFRCAAAFQGGKQSWVTDEVSWSIEPGLAATIEQNGLLRTQPGASGTEKVTASYHGWRAESEVEIQTVYQNRFDMVRIPAGEFLMGDDNGSEDEAPQHRVLTDAFEIGKFEVTNREYATFLTEALKRNVILQDANTSFKTYPPTASSFIPKSRTMTVFNNFL